MKKLMAALLVLVLVLGSSVCAFADDTLTDEQAEALTTLILLGALSDLENSGSSSGSSSSSKSGTPYVAPSTAPVTAVSPYTAYVRTNGGQLNVRRNANKGATILTKLNNGSELTVTGYTGDWLQVNANGFTGFVPRRYVSDATGASSSAALVSTSYYAIVNPTNNFVNMRAQPTKDSQVKGVYYYGYQLKVVAESGSWAQVVDEATGNTGYMMKSFLIKTGTPVADAGEQG